MSELSNVTIRQAADFLLENDCFHIICHANPDGDTFGSGFALCGALQSLGKKARVLCADEVPESFRSLTEGIAFDSFEPKTVVSVDIADKSLMGSLEEVYADKVDLAIDHHLSHVPFCEKRLIEADSAAACEVVYLVIKEMGVKITPQIARSVYTGIATDTGCFKFANTTPRTHSLAAEVMELDIDFARLNHIFFDMKSRQRLSVEQRLISEMEFYSEGRVALAVLTEEMIKSLDSEDVNGISALPRSIQGVEIGIVLKERDGKWKASLRSVDSADVQAICKKHGGGGHLRAAGCTLVGKLDEVKKAIVDDAVRAIENL